MFDKPPYAVIARRSRGIATPKDLEGKKLGAPAADDSFAQWPIFAKVNGIDTAKVAIENVGAPVREPMLAAGEVDAVTGCAFTVYVDLKDRGVPLEDLACCRWRITAWRSTATPSPWRRNSPPTSPTRCRRSCAPIRALKDTVRNPARAIDAVLHRNDTLKKDTELERLRMAIADNILTPAVKANGFGAVDPARLPQRSNRSR